MENERTNTKTNTHTFNNQTNTLKQKHKHTLNKNIHRTNVLTKTNVLAKTNILTETNVLTKTNVRKANVLAKTNVYKTNVLTFQEFVKCRSLGQERRSLRDILAVQSSPLLLGFQLVESPFPNSKLPSTESNPRCHYLFLSLAELVNCGNLNPFEGHHLSSTLFE